MEKQITSRLGFGLMRLPVLENGEIDQQQVNEMVDLAFANGINYFDTAYGYHSGNSERAVKKALVERHPRESFILADKLPFWNANSREDIEKIFEDQLEKTGAEYFDYYLLHAMNKDVIKKVREYGAVEFLKQKKAEGKINHIGFSFHDDAATLEDFLGDYEWEFIQLQLNYYDLTKEDYQKQLALCNDNNIPVVVMEPVRGGFLARTVPNGKKAIEEAYGENKSAALALSYVNNLDGVFMVLSGMSNMEQMQDNINTFKNPIPMDEKANEVIAKVLEEINNFTVVDCTKCEYCLPCPMNINIPEVFAIYNHYEMWKDQYSTKEKLKKLEAQPGDCIGCRACEAKCPQGIKISDHMAAFAEKIAKFK